jgi:RNA polymerase sigma factor (sigma-70 family)
LKLAKPAQVSADDHERVFIARYDALFAHATRLVGGDRSLADDLVQDAFVQFTTTQPDLTRVQNLDGYLATVVRNLHVSLQRRSSAHRSIQVAIHDYDSAALALASSSGEDRLRARDALVRLCRMACARMESSKAACVFLLRFFHDFYPSEIARLLRMTPEAVHASLWQARREARQWLEDPRQRHVIAREESPGRAFRALASLDSDDTIAELRSAIFSTRRVDIGALSCCHVWPPSTNGARCALPPNTTSIHAANATIMMRNAVIAIPPTRQLTRNLSRRVFTSLVTLPSDV